MINFPSSLDDFTNPNSTDQLNAVLVTHSVQHSNINDAVEALEAKVGINNSLVTGSFDYRIRSLESSPFHSPVTLGVANGLSLSGQQLSMSMAGANSTGTLSAQDWNTFNSKQSALSFPITPAQGGTGIINTGTFTNQSNSTIVGGGTISLGGFTLTVPASGTAALLARNNIFTRGQMVDGSQDEIQLRVQGNGTQTNYLQTWENVTGTVHAFMQNNGYFQDYGHSAFGANSNVNNPGQTFYPGTDYNSVLSIEEEFAISSVDYAYNEGLMVFVLALPSVDTGAYVVGADIQVQTSSVGTKDIADITGIYGSVNKRGGGDITSYMAGLEYYAYDYGTGTYTISAMYGISAATYQFGSGLVNDMFGLWVAAYPGDNTTNAYGLYIDSVSGAGTGNYAIYTNAGKVSFGGNLFLRTIKSGATQAAAGAAANEVWKTNGHATLPNNVLMIGV